VEKEREGGKGEGKEGDADERRGEKAE